MSFVSSIAIRKSNKIETILLAVLHQPPPDSNRMQAPIPLKKCLMSSIGMTPPPKSTDVASSSNVRSYIPPHLRKTSSAPTNVNTSVDLLQEYFPSLGIAATTTVEKKPMISFKTKLDALIEFEKLSEVEKQRRMEARRAMEGFEVLPLRLTIDYREQLFQQHKAFNEAVIKYQRDAYCGLQDLISLETLPVHKTTETQKSASHQEYDTLDSSFFSEEDVYDDLNTSNYSYSA